MKVPKARKLPSGSWFIQLRIGGESVPVTSTSEKDCTHKAELIKAEYRNGRQLQRLSCGDKTLSSAIDDYIAERSNTLSPSTIMGYRTIQHNRFRSVMKRPVRGLTKWQGICNREAELCSAQTLKNAYRLVSSVLNRNGVYPESVTLPQVVKHERQWLRPEQINIFVRAVKGKKCEIPALLALHSLRRSEICALKWPDIDLKNKCIHVHGSLVPNEHYKMVLKKTTKNTSSNRIIPIMIPELLFAVKTAKKDHEMVVAVMPQTLGNQINSVCRVNGLPEVGVHGLRHSFASLAYHVGMPERDCMRIGGWSDSTTMNNIYTHLSELDVKNYANKMSDFYKNANKNANQN